MNWVITMVEKSVNNYSEWCSQNTKRFDFGLLYVDIMIHDIMIYTVYTVYTVCTVYTVYTVDTVDTVYTAHSAHSVYNVYHTIIISS